MIRKLGWAPVGNYGSETWNSETGKNRMQKRVKRDSETERDDSETKKMSFGNWKKQGN